MADHEVRFPETYVSGVPVWAKRRKRSSVHPLLNLVLILLALFGAVVIGVSLRMGSVEKGGVVIDHWLGEGGAHMERLIRSM
jgi:hypothetical protein